MVGEPGRVFMNGSRMDRCDRERILTFSVMFGVSLAVFVASSVGCSSQQSDQTVAVSESVDGATAAQNDPENRSSLTPTDAQRLSKLIEQSRNNLALRLNVKAAVITVVEARYVVWPNASVGCPKPGYVYIQMLTHGVLIRLKVNDRIYQYHSGVRGPAVLCENPAPIDPPSKSEER